MKKPMAKIVATLGPATFGKSNIQKLAKAGVNVFRMNFSHGDHATLQENYAYIRELAQKNDTHYSVLADLQGPKLRVSKFKNQKITLKKGQSFQLDMQEKLGDETRVSLMHPEIFAVIKPNMTLLLNDGQIRLKVTKTTKKTIQTTVLVGGELSDHKGVNVPDVSLPISALTEKDIKDLKFALKMGVDWVCLSFVQKPEDVLLARKLIKHKASIIVKIEKPSALEHLDELISLADGVMVARGDLGVECPLETVPMTQRDIVEKCRNAGKPVIVATQMLESMIHAPVPTRAEVSDVANAVFEGADAVMLSAETAVGSYPFEAVSMMREIILNVQEDASYKKAMERSSLPPDHSIASAITSSMRQMVKVLQKPACIITYSMSGATTLRAARERLPLPILNLTVEEKIANKMALVWGVSSIVTPQLKGMRAVTPLALKKVKELKLGHVGNNVIITAGLPFAKEGSTNILHIATIK